MHFYADMLQRLLSNLNFEDGSSLWRFSSDWIVKVEYNQLFPLSLRIYAI